MDKIRHFALMSVSYTQVPNIHLMRREMLKKICINYYLHIKNTNRRFSDNTVHYHWTISFVIIVSAISLYLLAAILHFFQYLIKRQSQIGWIWGFFHCGKLLTLFLMRIWALLEVLLAIAWTVIFHFHSTLVCWTTPCTSYN